MRILLVIAASIMLRAQTFEVATVKVRPPEAPRTRPDIQSSPGSLTMRDVSVGNLLMWSYKISPWQISDISLFQGYRYDIVAKAATPAPTDEMRVMVQGLLAERFHLKLHRETKEISAYALVEAKGGHKLTPSAAADGPGVLPVAEQDKITISSRAGTLDQLAMFLSDPARIPVVDKTGLHGRFDLTNDLTDLLRGSRQPGEPEMDPVAILQRELPKQIGLRLEARKLPIQTLVIDHIETKPVEN
jgi:uncharacterized protein (TIGR03435 family)